MKYDKKLYLDSLLTRNLGKVSRDQLDMLCTRLDSLRVNKDSFFRVLEKVVLMSSIGKAAGYCTFILSSHGSTIKGNDNKIRYMSPLDGMYATQFDRCLKYLVDIGIIAICRAGDGWRSGKATVYQFKGYDMFDTVKLIVTKEEKEASIKLLYKVFINNDMTKEEAKVELLRTFVKQEAFIQTL